MIDTRNNLPDMSDAYAKVVEEGKKKDRWQDDDGDGKWYEKSDVDGKISKREKEEKKKNQKEEVEGVDEAMSSYDKARKAAARRAADRNAARRRGELGGRMERESYTSEGGTRMHYKGYKAKANEEVDNDLEEAMLLTRADKKGNTPAWQNRDKKNPKTGKPIYKKADHLNKEEAEIETLKKMELFSDDEIQSIVDKLDFAGEE